MPFRTPTPVSPGLLGRGIHCAPWLGAEGELVLIAIASTGRLVEGPITIPAGADRIAIAEAMWDRLELADPVPRLKVC